MQTRRYRRQDTGAVIPRLRIRALRRRHLPPCAYAQHAFEVLGSAARTTLATSFALVVQDGGDLMWLPVKGERVTDPNAEQVELDRLRRLEERVLRRAPHLLDGLS